MALARRTTAPIIRKNKRFKRFQLHPHIPTPAFAKKDRRDS
jgi:hypothetical protein